MEDRSGRSYIQKRDENKWADFWKFFRFLALGLSAPTAIVTAILVIMSINGGDPLAETIRIATFCILLYLMLVTMGAVWRWRLNRAVEQAKTKKKRG